MTESAFTAKLLKALRSHAALKDAVVWKHADRISAGIPDFSVTVSGRTTWWEVKVKPNVMTKLQSYYLAKLHPCGFLIRASKDGRQVDFFNAEDGCGGGDFKGAIEEIVRRCVDA